MSPSRLGPRRGTAFLLAAIIPAIVLAGCSDDVVCPVDTTPGVEPFVSARVVEISGARGDTTRVVVRAAADSIPTLLFVSINDRQIDDVTIGDDFSLVVGLEEDSIIWQPGTRCSLKVTTNYGFATSSVVVPSGPLVTAPGTVPLGDPVIIEWSPADDADYYVLRGWLDSGGVPVEITATVRDSVVTIDAAEIPSAGVLRGYVESLAGPFPEIGSDGNVGGAGRGFFTVAYRGPVGAFEVAVVAPTPPTP
jgi:hypothetical protein